MEISTDERFYSSLRHIAEKFNASLKKVNRRWTTMLPSGIDKDKLFDAIIYQIITKMKAKFLEDNILIKNQTLIKILINYDKKTDLIIASALVKITPNMLLDSIYDFGLHKLKTRWNEIASLVNENHIQLMQKPIFNELLRFLIMNMDYKVKEAHVISLNKRTTICDSNFKPFPCLNQSIIDNLIEIAPSQIFIHIDNEMNTKIINEIAQLFPNCVCIESTAVL